MLEITQEEMKIIERWRELKDWGELMVIKQNGRLYEVNITNKYRALQKQNNMVA